MTDTRTRPTTTSPALRSLQVVGTLAVLALIWQFVTAGELFPRGGPEELHAWGAIVLHVTTGLTMLAAAAWWRTDRAPLWPVVVAAVVFVLSFVQAYYGGRDTLWIHVPGAVVLTIGSVWVLARSFGGDRDHRAGERSGTSRGTTRT